MPSRTYNILAVGKPILALTETGSELARVVEEEGIGWITPPGEPESLTRVVLEIVGDSHRLPAMAEAARAAALEKYSLATALDKYRREL